MSSSVETRVERLVEAYGGMMGEEVAAWRKVLNRPADRPVTLINFFKFRQAADYRGGEHPPASGQEAFGRYGAVSQPGLERVGGRFVMVAPFEAVFMGADEPWDLVVVGAYPSTLALLDLLEAEDYRAAFSHRMAACERQRVLACGA